MMKPIDDGLLLAASNEKADPALIAELFERWYKLHIGRVAILGIPTVVGIWAVVSQP